MATTPLATMLSYCERTFAGTTQVLWLRKLITALQGNIDAGGGGGGVTDGDKGDIIVSGSGTVYTVDSTVALGNNARVAVRKNTGAVVGTRRRLNLIEGAGVTLTVADDPGSEEVDVTIAATPGGSVNALQVEVFFGPLFTDKAQEVVTGEAWVTATSAITATVLTGPAGTDPDEMYLLDIKPVISDLVVGDGFTITLYSQPEARGSYVVNCIGV